MEGQALPPPKKKLKRAERDLPHKRDETLPQSRLYSRLLRFEQRLDATIARKEAEITAVTRVIPQPPKTLRLFVSHIVRRPTPQTQGGEQPEEDEGEEPEPVEKLAEEPPGWTLKLQGVLLHTDTMQPSRNAQYCLSNFVHKMVIQLDPNQYPDHLAMVEWRKDMGVGLTDGFEVKRLAKEDCDVKISLWMDNAPKKYKVLRPLSKILDLDHGTRQDVLRALHQYIEEKQLREEGVLGKPMPDAIKLDKELLKVVQPKEGQATIVTEDLLKQIQSFLVSPDPVVIKRTIRMSGEGPPPPPDIYDIKVNAADSWEKSHFPSGISHTNQQCEQEVKRVQEQIDGTIAEIRTQGRRREFLKAFSEAPRDVVNMMINAQTKEAYASSNQIPDKTRRKEYYSKEWVPDAVDRYLRSHVPARQRAREEALRQRQEAQQQQHAQQQQQHPQHHRFFFIDQ